MNRRSLVCTLSLAVLTVALWVGPASAQEAGPLDGRQYVIALNDPTAGVLPDHLIFGTGTFESVGCRLYGYGPAAYTTAQDGDAVTFSASASSDTEGAITWQGRVVGDQVEGSMVWSKEGQDDATYTYTGHAVSNALDGRTFTATMTPAEPSGETDTLIFANGTFDSEGCRPYGFTPTAYGAQEGDGGGMMFSVLTYSPAEGMMAWTGNVAGDQIDGQAIWIKLGQEPTSFTFTGSAATAE